MIVLGTLRPGSIGYYGVDWSRFIAAVPGDGLDGIPTIVSESGDLSITNPRMNGAALVFNASATLPATYTLVATASFLPSGRRESLALTLRVAEGSAAEPISLDEARQFLRVEPTGDPPQHPEDALIESSITAARQRVERATGLALITTLCIDYRDSWPIAHERHGARRSYAGQHYGIAGAPLREPGSFGGGCSFLLDRCPVLSIESIRYLDTDGTLQTWPVDQYRSTPDLGRMRIEPAPGATLPATYAGHGAIKVNYTAGWPGPIDEALVAAVRLMLGALYETRGAYGADQEPAGFASLVNGYRVYS